MNKKISFLLLFLISILFFNSSILFSQWVWQNPYPQSNHLFGVYFPNANTGVMTGYVGTVLRTTNGGTNWIISYIGATQKNLNKMCFVDANTGYAVGSSGSIFKTTNGGVNWTSQTNGATDALMGVHFINANTGNIVCLTGKSFRTTNGGANWSVQTVGSSTTQLNDVRFIDENTGVAVAAYDSTIYRTTNGGDNWTRISYTTNRNSMLLSVSFIDNSTGIAAGYTGSSNYIYKTTNAD